MGKHVSFSISIPIEIASEIEDYCTRTHISKSRYAAKLLEVGLRTNQLAPVAIAGRTTP